MAVIQRVGSPAKPRKWMGVHEINQIKETKEKRYVAAGFFLFKDF